MALQIYTTTTATTTTLLLLLCHVSNSYYQYYYTVFIVRYSPDREPDALPSYEHMPHPRGCMMLNNRNRTAPTDPTKIRCVSRISRHTTMLVLHAKFCREYASVGPTQRRGVRLESIEDIAGRNCLVSRRPPLKSRDFNGHLPAPAAKGTPKNSPRLHEGEEQRH